MKWIKGTCLAVVLSLSIGSAAQGAEIEKPTALDGALATVTASDLHGLIDGVGSVASQISPMVNGMMLKGMIGSNIGDPQLAGIAPGKGMAVVVLDPETMFAVVEMSEAQLPACTNALAMQGVQCKYSDGLLVIGQTPEHVEKGVAQAAVVKTSLLAKRSPTLRIALKPAECVATHNDDIQSMLAMMPMMMGMGLQQDPNVTPEKAAGLIRIIEGEIHVLLSLAEQIEAAEITLAPANGSIRINEVIAPVAGSTLATFCNAPKVNKENPKLHSGLLNNGAIKLDLCFSNPDALTALISTEADQLVKTMNLGEAPLVNGYVQMLKKWTGAYGGTGCEVIRFGGEEGFGVDYLMEVKDETAALELMKNIQADVETMGVTKLYEDLGMPMSFGFKENVREHAGVKIHQLKMEMALEEMPAEQKEQLDAMGMDDLSYEFAIVDGVMACTMGKGQIEKLIDTVKAAKADAPKLKARTVYPAGAGYYFDLDIGEYLSFIASAMPADQSPPMSLIAPMLKGAEPVTGAGFREDGRLMWSINVPGDLLSKIGQASMKAMEMQMQTQMQQAVEELEAEASE